MPDLLDDDCRLDSSTAHREEDSIVPSPDPKPAGEPPSHRLGAAHIRPIGKALEHLEDARMGDQWQGFELLGGGIGQDNAGHTPILAAIDDIVNH